MNPIFLFLCPEGSCFDRSSVTEHSEWEGTVANVDLHTSPNCKQIDIEYLTRTYLERTRGDEKILSNLFSRIPSAVECRSEIDFQKIPGRS